MYGILRYYFVHKRIQLFNIMWYFSLVKHFPTHLMKNIGNLYYLNAFHLSYIRGLFLLGRLALHGLVHFHSGSHKSIKTHKID